MQCSALRPEESGWSDLHCRPAAQLRSALRQRAAVHVVSGLGVDRVHTELPELALADRIPHGGSGNSRL